MCLYNEPKLSRKLYNRMKHGKTTFYKVYQICCSKENKIRSYIRKVDVKSFGIVNSGRKNNLNCLKDNDYQSIEVNRGIHVCLTLNGTRNYKYYDNQIIVKVKAKPEDLLGCDTTDAVFTKIEITKDEWDKAIKKVVKYKKRYNY